MDEKKEFTFIRLNIVDLSIIYAMFLIIWVMSISIISESNSITSLIPSILGLPILVFSYLSKVFPSKQKLFMHLVVIIGALIFLGGLDFIRENTEYLFFIFWRNYLNMIEYSMISSYTYYRGRMGELV